MKFHERALTLSKDYKRVEVELMSVLQEIDKTKEFRELGYGSLFEYVVHGLKLTEAQAYSLITVARKAKQVPELQLAVGSGEISISQAKRIAPVINPQNATEWIEKVQTLSQKLIEKEVAALNPKLAVQERTKYVSRDRIKIELGVSEEFIKKLKRAQELMAQGNHTAPDMEKAFEKVLDFYIQRQDPVEKAKRAQAKPASRQEDAHQVGLEQNNYLRGGPGTPNEPNLETLTRSMNNAVKLRDQAQCTFTSQGRRCTNKLWFHTHHVVSRSAGGTNHIGNLRTLCATHHRCVHEELG